MMQDNTLANMGSRIAAVRRAHNVTQETLANQLDVSPKHISHVENSTSCLSLKNLVTFCNLYHCSLDYLVLGKTGNDTLDKLSPEILKILSTGTDHEIERLNKYLQVYVDLLEEN